MGFIKVPTVYLGNIGKHIVLGIFEDEGCVFCFFGSECIVKHIGGADCDAFFSGSGFDELDPVLSPLRGCGCFVVHAIEDVSIVQAVG